MVNPLEKSVRIHFRHLKRMAGVVAVYRRGITTSNEFIAVPGNRLYSQDDGDGVIFQSRDDDLLVEAADLVIGVSPVAPDRYDEIDLLDGSGGTVIRTIKVASDPPFEASDQFGIVLRIHAKKV